MRPVTRFSLLQTVRCWANRTSVASRLSCGPRPSERKRRWIFSWKRLDASDYRQGNACPSALSLALHWSSFSFIFFLRGGGPQNNCEGARERPDAGQLRRLRGHRWVSSQTWSGHWHLWLGMNGLSLHHRSTRWIRYSEPTHIDCCMTTMWSLILFEIKLYFF